MTDLGVDPVEYSARRLLTGSYDVWHIHWPEGLLNEPSAARAAKRVGRLLFMMDVARCLGTKMVWTIHNLGAHEEQHPRIARWFRNAFIRRLDGFISLSATGEVLATQKFHHLKQLPGYIVPHSHYRGIYPNEMTEHDARERLGLEHDVPVVAFVGQVRRYKGVMELCAAFRGVSDRRARLVVAGDPKDHQLARDLESQAASDPRIQLHLRFVPDVELQQFFRAADLVVLPFQQVLNSGSALLALSFDRPILVPRTGALAELADRVGPEWVRTYDVDLTSLTLIEAIRWTRLQRRSCRPTLDSLDWPTAAQHTANALRAINEWSRASRHFVRQTSWKTKTRS